MSNTEKRNDSNMEREKLIESIVELLKDCNDLELFYLIQSLLITNES